MLQYRPQFYDADGDLEKGDKESFWEAVSINGFWDMAESQDWPDDFENSEMEECAALCQDYQRIKDQASELAKMMPHKKDDLKKQRDDAIDEIERKLKAILGSEIIYKKGNE